MDRPGMDRPWTRLPRLDGVPRLIDTGQDLCELFDLPDGSAAAFAWIDENQGNLVRAQWRQTGSLGFYPASTIKWVTAFLAIERAAQQGLGLDHVLQVGDDPPGTLRDLLAAMVVMSDNPAFNALQEWVGFAQTHAAMAAWDCRDSLIRRHFTRPHWNYSRRCRLWDPTGAQCPETPPRPAVDLPLNADPTPDSPRDSNWFTCDDLLRCAAATLMGHYRDLPLFDAITCWLGFTNQCAVRTGLARLTAQQADRPGFVVLNKPGWWPPDGANSELCYIHDIQRGQHYFLAIYVQGEHDQAQVAIAHASELLFSAVRSGAIKPH